MFFLVLVGAPCGNGQSSVENPEGTLRIPWERRANCLSKGSARSCPVDFICFCRPNCVALRIRMVKMGRVGRVMKKREHTAVEPGPK